MDELFVATAYWLPRLGTGWRFCPSLRPLWMSSPAAGAGPVPARSVPREGGLPDHGSLFLISRRLAARTPARRIPGPPTSAVLSHARFDQRITSNAC
jgi:hypothetical protein